MDRPERIVIDATMARSGGGYTYIANIIPRLAENTEGRKFRLMLRSARLFEQLSDFARHPDLQIDLLPEARIHERLRFTYLTSPRLAKAWNADIYFSVGESLPAHGPFARIASFRNPAVFTQDEEAIAPKNRTRYRLLRAVARMSARRAHQVMFVSADSAQWIGDRLGLPRERRFVNHHGIDPTPWRGSSGGSPPRERPYILSVSHLYCYKNFVRLVKAFGDLVRKTAVPHDLVIIGDTRQEPDTYHAVLQARKELGSLASRVHVLGEVPYEHIPGYYRHADLFVFPSFLETFGHPLLEAMACDVPVVAADLPVFREVAGEAALYGNAFEPAGMSRAMAEVLLRFGTKEALVKRGREVVRDFSWDRSARRLSELFQRAVEIREAASGRVRRDDTAPGRVALPA